MRRLLAGSIIVPLNLIIYKIVAIESYIQA